jgi:HEAT repeat protein
MLSAPLGQKFDRRLGRLLEDKDAGMRRVAAAIVARYNREHKTKHLLKEIEQMLASDPKDQNKSQAAWALGFMKSQESAGMLINVVRSRHTGLCLTAIRALAEIGDARVLPVLAEVIKDQKQKQHIRNAAARARDKIMSGGARKR